MVNGVTWRQPAAVQGLLYLLATALVLAGGIANRAGAAVPSGLSSRVQFVVDPQPVPDFELTSADAKVVRFSELRGSTVLVFFGFTNCQSVCPPAMQSLRQMTRELSTDESRLTTVLISVDGERDTPQVMKAYLEPLQPGFVGLTGDPMVIRKVAATFSAIFFKGMPRDQSGGYDVEHTSQIYVVDEKGRLRATFYNAPVDEMRTAIRHVMTEEQGQARAEAAAGPSAG